MIQSVVSVMALLCLAVPACGNGVGHDASTDADDMGHVDASDGGSPDDADLSDADGAELPDGSGQDGSDGDVEDGGSHDGLLRAHPSNSRYFTDDSGRAIYLAGSHTWYLIQTNHDHPPRTDEELEDYLDWMQSHGHNYTRLWTNFSYLGDDGEAAELQGPWPWNRDEDDCCAHDGGHRFDMTSWNEAYFERLRDWVQRIEDRGMYCSVMIFGSFNGMRSAFENTAWHRSNNVNSELDGFSRATDFFTTDEDALEVQRALARKMVEVLHDVDNLIWEIINEPGGSPHPQVIDWRNAMADDIRSFESSTYGRQHLVLMGGGYQAGEQQLTEESTAEVISPDWPAYGTGGPAGYDDKVVINDSDHLSPFYAMCLEDEPDIRRWVWQTFTRGNHPIFMDPYDDDRSGCECSAGCNEGAIDPRWDTVRTSLGDTVTYARRFSDLAVMIPSSAPEDCSTRYCLRGDEEREFLIYQPEGGAFDMELPEGAYTYEWFNPNGTGSFADRIVETGTADGGTTRFVPPFDGEAVLYLSGQ